MRIDLLDPASFAHGQPHDQFAWLRAHAPVYRRPEPQGPGFWAITRYEDVRAVGRDPAAPDPRLGRRIVDAVIERGECDFVTDVAGEMPSFVIADLLGLPLHDGRRLYHLTPGRR